MAWGLTHSTRKSNVVVSQSTYAARPSRLLKSLRRGPNGIFISCKSLAVQHFSVLRANRPVTCQPLVWARESVSGAAATVAATTSAPSTRRTQDAIVDSDAELRTSGPRSPRARRRASTFRRRRLPRTCATPPRRPSNSRIRLRNCFCGAPAASRGSPSCSPRKRSAFSAAPARSSFAWSRCPPGPSSRQ